MATPCVWSRMFDDQPMSPCPVCGCLTLAAPAWSGGAPSFDICPACGMASGVEDVDDAGEPDLKRRAAWRADWIREGMPWRSSVVPEPDVDWRRRPLDAVVGRDGVTQAIEDSFSTLGFDSRYGVELDNDGHFQIDPVGWTLALPTSGTGFSAATCTPDPEVLLLVSEGEARLAWPQTQQVGSPIALMVYGVVGLPATGLVLLNNHDHFVAIGAAGEVRWTTRPISLCSDFQQLRVQGRTLVGIAEGYPSHLPFEVDLQTGEKTGGFWTD